MPTSENPLSTTNAPRHFQTQNFYSGVRRRYLVAWDYTDSKRHVHSGVSRTIHRARLAAQRASNETID